MRVTFEAIVSFDNSGRVCISPRMFDEKSVEDIQAARAWFKGKSLKLCDDGKKPIKT